jgi:hypothetical protein
MFWGQFYNTQTVVKFTSHRPRNLRVRSLQAELVFIHICLAVRHVLAGVPKSSARCNCVMWYRVTMELR